MISIRCIVMVIRSHRNQISQRYTSTPEGEKKQKELEEELESKWEAAQQEWQDMVDECAQKEANSHGAFHHWVNDSDGDGAEEPDEAKSFQESGCEESRDTTYDNFINLRYSYTFREEDPRDGYIIHGENVTRMMFR